MRAAATATAAAAVRSPASYVPTRRAIASDDRVLVDRHDLIDVLADHGERAFRERRQQAVGDRRRRQRRLEDATHQRTRRVVGPHRLRADEARDQAARRASRATSPTASRRHRPAPSRRRGRGRLRAVPAPRCRARDHAIVVERMDLGRARSERRRSASVPSRASGVFSQKLIVAPSRATASFLTAGAASGITT